MTRNDSRPIAVTMGDPAGIGPDILLDAAARRKALDVPSIVAIADPGVLVDRAGDLGLDLRIAPIDSIAKAQDAGDALPVLPVSCGRRVIAGKPSAEAAAAVIAAIEQSVSLVRAGQARAVVTGPIAKKVLMDAGFAHPGHTEFLAELAQRGWGHPVQPVMLLAADELRVVPLTVHVPLAAVPSMITRERLMTTAGIVHAALIRDFGMDRPRIAIAGLNPHAGECGAIGREEIEVIGPAIADLRSGGMAVTGPHSADTMFHDSARTAYDAAIAMYHDQALIPLKTLAFDRGVNVTLGLPFVRTSPDHGTAFDIAGSGRASSASLVAALRLADRIARQRASALGGGL